MNGQILVPQRAVLVAEDCCGRCKHFHEATSVPPMYFCRRFPPVPFPVIVMGQEGPQQAGAVSNFPSVLPEHVCGEFKRRVHHGHASAT